jgi:hypothetical protein
MWFPIRVCALALCVGLALSSCTTQRAHLFPHEDPQLAHLATDRLDTFESEREFYQYMRELQRISDRQNDRWRRGMPADLLEREDRIMVTGSRIVGRPAATPTPLDTDDETGNITNTQEANVDEGDIVKRIDNYLISLQDGRLSSIELGTGDATSPLLLVDRYELYTDPEDDTWFDEMLVYDRTITVTGYSYDQQAAIISVSRLSAAGSIEPVASFWVMADDYYSSSDYATRLIGSTLILHTPLHLSYVDLDKGFAWPSMALAPSMAGTSDTQSGAPLLAATDVHRPLQTTLEPILHSVVRCDLATMLTSDDLNCDATAFIAPAGYVSYVSPDNIYVWTFAGWDEMEEWSFWSDACQNPTLSHEHGEPDTLLYRIAAADGQLAVTRVDSAPVDQFGAQERERQLRFVSVEYDRTYSNCARQGEQTSSPNREVQFATLAPHNFGGELRDQLAGNYSPLPLLTGENRLEIRFTESHVVGVSTIEYAEYIPVNEVVFPDAAGWAARINTIEIVEPFTLPHAIARLERLGDDVLATGYNDGQGLNLSLIALSDTAHIAMTQLLEGRFESEDRSHAFNYNDLSDGSVLLGLPTIDNHDDANRSRWGVEAADLSYFTLDSTRTELEIAGTLNGDCKVHETYVCEVSCIDWYGNSRPIFTLGRMFALSGTELIEAHYVNGQVEEIQRLDMTTPLND